MSEPTPSQALLLFGLLARHGSCAQSELMPAVTKQDREALVRAKLITAGKIGRGLHLTLEDAGWAWAAAHLSAELPPPHRTLQDFLSRLGEHLEKSGETLADFIGSGIPAPAAPPKPAVPKKAAPKKTDPGSNKRKPPAAPTPAATRKRIEAAYLAITGGRRSQTVRLADLRARLADLDRATLDAALGRILQGDKTASLMRHDDPRQLHKADHEAAFNPGGEPFHVIWIA
jgi:hypothetical protein